MIKQGKVWGDTSPLFNKSNVEVHLIHAKKGGFCSKHFHKTKFNQFTVIYGSLKITVWKKYATEILQDVSIIRSGETCVVSPGDYHRFEALENTQALEIYWVELSENDIVREDHGGSQDETPTSVCDAIARKREGADGDANAIAAASASKSYRF